MSSFQAVAGKAAQVAGLLAGVVYQGVSTLFGKAEKSSFDEMSRRLDGALRALRGEYVPTSAGVATPDKTYHQTAEGMVNSCASAGKMGASTFIVPAGVTFTVPAGVTDVAAMKPLGEEVSTSCAVATTKKTSRQTAQDMVDSHEFDSRTGVSTLTVPAGVTDVEAMKPLGEEVSTSCAVATTREASLQTAQDMVDSYEFDSRTRVSTFTVPAGVTDVAAMKALNELFSVRYGLQRGAIFAGELTWFENLPREFSAYCEQRDYLQARQIKVIGVFKGTKGVPLAGQERKLQKHSCVFSDPRDQALAAAIHACKHNQADLFGGSWVRGSVPGFALHTDDEHGVFVFRQDGRAEPDVAASGSPRAGTKIS